MNPKKFTRDNFLAFMAEESVTDEDSTVISSHGMAQEVLDRFEAWLDRPPQIEDVMTLPVRVDNCQVLDAQNRVISTSQSPRVAEALAAKLNEEYVPDDDDPFHPDEEDEDEDEDES